MLEEQPETVDAVAENRKRAGTDNVGERRSRIDGLVHLTLHRRDIDGKRRTRNARVAKGHARGHHVGDLNTEKLSEDCRCIQVVRHGRIQLGDGAPNEGLQVFWLLLGEAEDIARARRSEKLSQAHSGRGEHDDSLEACARRVEREALLVSTQKGWPAIKGEDLPASAIGVNTSWPKGAQYM